MSECALLVGGRCVIVYSFAAFADLFVTILERVIGRPLGVFIAHRQQHSLSGPARSLRSNSVPPPGEVMWLRGPQTAASAQSTCQPPGTAPKRGPECRSSSPTSPPKSATRRSSPPSAWPTPFWSRAPNRSSSVTSREWSSERALAARGIAGGRVLRRRFFEAFPFRTRSRRRAPSALRAARQYQRGP